MFCYGLCVRIEGRLDCGSWWTARGGLHFRVAIVFVESACFEGEAEVDCLRTITARNDLTNSTLHAMHAPTMHLLHLCEKVEYSTR